MFQAAGICGGAVLGPLVPGSHHCHASPHHPLQLLCPPLHPRQDRPPPVLRAPQSAGGAGDAEGLPEQVQEGGVQLEGPGAGQASRGGGEQDGPQQRIKHPVETDRQISNILSCTQWAIMRNTPS